MPELKLASLSLKKGDLLVAKCHAPLSSASAETIRDYIQQRLPDGVKLLVIGEQIDIGKIEWMDNDV